jgi:hypothetical protein
MTHNHPRYKPTHQPYADTSARTARKKATRKKKWDEVQNSVLSAFASTELLPQRAQRDFLALLLGTTSRRVQVSERSAQIENRIFSTEKSY